MFKFITEKESAGSGSVLVLGSANGSGNLGDEAMFESLAFYYYENFPQIDIITDASCMSYKAPCENVKEIFPMYGANRTSFIQRGLEFLFLHLTPRLAIWYVKNFNSDLKDYYKSILKSEYIIISGAGAINSRYKGYGIYGWGSVVLLAKALNKNVYITGQGLGPFTSRVDKFSVLSFLKKVNHVRCRDKKSFDFLLKNKLKNASFSLDDATFIPKIGQDDFVLLKEKNNINKKYVVLSLHDWYDSDKTAFLQECKKSTDDLLKKGCQVVLLGNKIKNKMNDIIFLSSFKNNYYPDNEDVILLTPPYRSNVSKTIISNSELLITTRYHPAIFAYEEKIPVIALAYDAYYIQKFEGALISREDKKYLIMKFNEFSNKEVNKLF